MKIFLIPIILTISSFFVAGFYGGVKAVFLTLVLASLEISLSFDNAVINAVILKKMSFLWRKIFLTIGIFVSVLIVRLILPIFIVSFTVHMSPLAAFHLALKKLPATDPNSYAAIITGVHTQIASFGACFLLMVALDFFIHNQENFWLTWLEKPLAFLKHFNRATIILVIIILLITSTICVKETKQILFSGLLGIVTYLIIHDLGTFFNSFTHQVKNSIFLFIYLELLDASFSLDGVISAFSITTDPILILLGLGIIGSIFVRAFTISLVKLGALNYYPYLVHGAHWAIGGLGIIMLLSIKVSINEIIPGGIGVGFILAAMVSSIYCKIKTTS